jgi:antitoxin MazE
MSIALHTRIVRIGNSQGIRIPKPLLEQAGISDQVELEVADGRISIRPAARSRAGWEERFAAMAAADDDRLIDEARWASTAWDEEEWEW